jgi:DNA end-binding protein Ku
MPRAIWTGSISFGLVNVPVKLYPAVRQNDIHFSQFEEGTGAKIRYKRVSDKTGEEVPWEKIVKGYEISKGHFVTIDPEELEAAQPEATRTIDIEDFVELDDIDPIYYEHTYYLAPTSGEGGPAKAYRLLLEAMEQQGKVAIGRVVLRTKQYLAAIRPLEGVLALSTMLFADEVVDRKALDDLPKKSASVSDRELGMASQIIDSLTTDWDPSRYHDTYRDKILELIDKKAAGEEIVTGEAPAESGKVVDLLAALEASLAAAKKDGDGKEPSEPRSPAKAGSRTKKATNKRAPTRKTAAKKTSKTASHRKSA